MEACFPGSCYPTELFLDKKSTYENFLCSICLGICKNIVNDECGHTYGEVCIQKCTKQKSCCPLTNKVYSKESKFYPIISLRQHILSLSVRCRNKACKWEKDLQQLENHLQTCPFEEITCKMEGCQAKFERQNLKSHLKKECDFNKISCIFAQKNGCSEKVADKNMLKHLYEHHSDELREAAEKHVEQRESQSFELPRFEMPPHLDSTRSSFSYKGFTTPQKIRKDGSLHDLMDLRNPHPFFKKPLENLEETALEFQAKTKLKQKK